MPNVLRYKGQTPDERFAEIEKEKRRKEVEHRKSELDKKMSETRKKREKKDLNSRVMDEILANYEKVINWNLFKNKEDEENYGIEKSYSAITNYRRIMISHNEENIKEFCKYLSSYSENPNFKKNTGLYLSYLVNGIIEEEKEITLYLKDLPTIDCLGCGLRRGIIRIDENAGNYTGADMRGGLISVGNAGDGTGYHNYGGKIIVYGDAGRETGLKNVGIIEVHGNIDSLSKNIKVGNIYHKGRQIVKDGKILFPNEYKAE